MGWTYKIPTEPGSYWFYGYRSPFAKTQGLIELMYVKARSIANGKLMFQTDGAFLFPSEIEGQWHSVIVPELPAQPAP